ncbi:MAG: hypothetical protein Q7S46_02990 [Gallionella sp.]|nr:hypothetical protein [Gallionella sp.]
MPVDDFDQWFANYLAQDASEVACLLNDKTATRFLIVWSIFETSCFAKYKDIEDVAKYLVGTAGFQPSELMVAANHFHNRYQDKELYGNLMWKQKSPKLEAILSRGFAALSADEIAFLTIFVVYRYRNNIFHGNKGVASWLKFQDQIKLCIKVMQTLITFVVEELQRAAEHGDADAQETLKKLSIDRKK